jgi:SHS2 domain-containing protein
MQVENKWEHFTHKADIGIRGFGPTLTDAFAMGALALTNIVTDSNKIKANKKIHISCTAPDEEILFADWLNAIIYKMDTLNMLFCEFNIKLDHLNLEATIKGEPIDRNRHQPAVDVKGATYTELKVYKEKGRWIAQCVIDV